MGQPLVSVIIPVFNGQRFLDETIASVLNQVYWPLEVIVIDDGSTDESAEIVRRHADVRYHFQENRGQTAALNTGVKLATAKFLAFLDQDDLWMPAKLATQMKLMQSAASPDFVLCHAIFFQTAGVNPPDWVRSTMFDQPRPSYCLGALLARRPAFEKIGRLTPEHGLAFDVDFFFRVKDQGYSLQIAPELLLQRRVHDRNLSANLQLRRDLLSVVRQSMRNKNSMRHE
ncbi:MAG: glycosyltransferase family 2 protein [Caldilineales bacterium]|nr:glycosyltransferase family 2 protein [Caldilineales bacterium]